MRFRGDEVQQGAPLGDGQEGCDTAVRVAPTEVVSVFVRASLVFEMRVQVAMLQMYNANLIFGADLMGGNCETLEQTNLRAR